MLFRKCNVMDVLLKVIEVFTEWMDLIITNCVLNLNSIKFLFDRSVYRRVTIFLFYFVFLLVT